MMAIDPIQYLPQPQQFGPAQGFAIGQGIRDIRADQAKQEALEQARKQADLLKQQYSADLQNAWNSPDKTRAFAELTTKYPQQREAFKQSMGMLSDEERDSQIKVTSQIYTALQNGKPEIAANILDGRIEARRNAGEDVADLELLRDNMVKDPENAKSYAGMMLSSTMGPEKFLDTFGGLGEERRKKALEPLEIKKRAAELTKFADDLDLSKAKRNKILAETKKINLDSRKALLELEAKKDKEGQITDPKDLFKAEMDLRKEWTKRSSDLNSANQNFNKIQISAKDGTGPGDIALITSFMKMLDPGSVVRETEFATAQDTTGVFDSLKNKLTKLEDGTLLGLDNTSRQRFVNLAKKYRDAAEEENKAVRKTFENNINSYGMDPNNIFDIEEDQRAEQASVQNFQEGMTATNPTTGAKMIFKNGNWESI